MPDEVWSLLGAGHSLLDSRLSIYLEGGKNTLSMSRFYSVRMFSQSFKKYKIILKPDAL